MKLLTRQEFVNYFEEIKKGFGNNNSPLWEYENYLGKRLNWFISVKPIHAWDELITSDHPQGRKQEFWSWCDRHCRGTVLCYSSSYREEWWGFTHKDDIVPWILKWQ